MLSPIKWTTLAIASFLFSSGAYLNASEDESFQTPSSHHPHYRTRSSQYSPCIPLPTFADPRYPSALQHMLGNPDFPEVFLDFVSTFTRLGKNLQTVNAIEYTNHGIQVLCTEEEVRTVWVQIHTFFDNTYNIERSFFSSLPNAQETFQNAKDHGFQGNSPSKIIILDLFNPKNFQQVTSPKSLTQYTLYDEQQTPQDYIESTSLNLGSLTPTENNSKWVSLFSSCWLNPRIPEGVEDIIQKAYELLALQNWSEEDVERYDLEACDPVILSAFKAGQKSVYHS